MPLNRVVKASNQRSKRALEKREPKINENDKNCLLLMGGRCSQIVKEILKDLAKLKKPLAISYQKKNVTRPFDDSSSLEFFSNKSDASLFIFGSHSKKRPNNIIFGRMFDFQVLDMFEFGVESFKSLQHFSTNKSTLGSKPILIFNGDHFEKDQEFSRLKNLLIDLFRGPKVSQIRLSGLEHCIQFSISGELLIIKTYKIFLKNSGLKIPRIELKAMGPFLELKFRRKRLASDDLFKVARKRPRENKIKKEKNIKQDAFGSKIAKIHMQSQDFNQLQTRKMKGLKKNKQKKREEEEEEEEEMDEEMNEKEGEREKEEEMEEEDDE